MPNDMPFNDLPIGARFDDSFGHTFIKIKPLEERIGNDLFIRDAITLESKDDEVRPGGSARFGGTGVVHNVVLPQPPEPREPRRPPRRTCDLVREYLGRKQTGG